MKEKATFAMNCFWGPQDFFSRIPGVVETTVGYTGGTTSSPTYKKLGDHTESLKIEFNPSSVSFEELLREFFERHDPTEKQKTQYKSAIFTHSKTQQEHSEKMKEEYEKRSGKTILTDIQPATTFYKAEPCHQHYLRKMRGEDLPELV